MPKRINARRMRDDYEDDVRMSAPRRNSLLRRVFSAILPRRISDTVALAVATAAALAVVVNAVAFQETPRSTLDSLLSRDAPNPQPRPNDAPVRNMTDLIQNIQRELSVRGFYNGAVDGVPGPRTEQAIRDFQKGKTGRNTLEPSDELLNQIRRVPVKGEISADITGSVNAPLEGERKSLRILSLQRALARLGYGPIRISGSFGPETKEAIERFEKDWMMPVTGLMSDNLFTKLAAVNGAPID